MTTTRADGPPAYVAAHRIAVIDGRLPFDEAYCLAKIVFYHAGGPTVPERTGPISLKLCKELAAQDLVFLTAEMREPTRAIVRLTVSALLIEELGWAPDGGTELTTVPTRRRKADWFVEVTQDGLDLVAAATEPD
jgi:hypothetical protein